MLQSACDKQALDHLLPTMRTLQKVGGLALLGLLGCLEVLKGDASWRALEACGCESHARVGLLAGSDQGKGIVAQSASSGRDLNSCRCQNGATPGHSRCRQPQIEVWSKCCLAGASMGRQ